MSTEHYTGPAGKVFWMPMDQLGDELVRSGDFDTWGSAWPELHRELRTPDWCGLENDIRENGLENPVDVRFQMGGWRSRAFVSDGHHRLAVLRRLGWSRFPYRWIGLGYNSPHYRDRPLDPEEILHGELIIERSAR